MQYLRLLCLMMAAVTLTGCESTRWNWFKPNTDAVAKGSVAPNVAGLVKYMNENASRIRSMRVDDMSIDASMGSQPIGLTGNLFAEKDRNFRMKVRALGKDEVDIGSNANEFWFWAARDPQPFQYFCSYDDLNSGRVKAMPIPVQPEWVMEALGMGNYGDGSRFIVEPGDAQTIKLVEKTRSPQGQPVRKVIVMHRKEVKAPTPQVTAFLLIDDQSNKEICSAHITSTKVDKTTGAIVPYKMELRVPSQQMKMVLKLDGMHINSPIAQIAPNAFVRQPMNGVESYNLGRGVVPVQGIQQGFQR